MTIRIQIGIVNDPLYTLEASFISFDGVDVQMVSTVPDGDLYIYLYSSNPAYVINTHGQYFIANYPWSTGTVVAQYKPEPKKGGVAIGNSPSV